MTDASDDFINDVTEEDGSDDKADQASLTFTPVEGLSLRASIGKTEEGRVIRSASAFKTAFGTTPPADLDFGHDWLAVYSAGVRTTGGFSAEITKIALSDSGSTVKVSSKLTTPGADCIVTQSLTKPVAVVEFAAQSGASRSRFAKQSVVKSCSGPVCGADLTTLLGDAAKDLLFPSETDAPFTPISFGNAGAPTVSLIRSLVKPPAGTLIEQRSFAALFDQLTNVFDPNDPDSIARAMQFAELRKVIEANLTGLTVFRVGKISIDIYILGTSACGELVGYKTLSVET